VTLFGYPVNPAREFSDGPDQGEPPRLATTAEAAASDFIVAGSISQNAIDTYVREALRADPVRADWNQLQQWNALDAAAVSLPTLLLQGQFDPLAQTPAHATVFSALANPNRQWVVLAGGDHAALLETPRARLLSASVSFIEWLEK
jgi:alpha-beta hydrolase superfamily lysophospholipase